MLAAAILLVPLALAVAQPTPAPRVEGEVIVKFRPDSSTLRKRALSAQSEIATVGAVLAERAGALGARVGRVLEAGPSVGPRAQVMRAQGVDAAALAEQLAADTEVEYAVPNGRKRAFTAPNDPLYAATAAGVRPRGPDSGQWYLRKPDATLKSAIDIEAAWARTRGSASVVVAVLDTGVRFEHPDLGRVADGGRLLAGYDFVSTTAYINDGDGRDADPSDPGDFVTAAEAATSTFTGCSRVSSWHGTTTASLIGAAADNKIGIAGAAPGVLVLPIRVLGKCYGSDADIAAAMLWAAGIDVDGVPTNLTPAKVMNLSLGGAGTCNALYRDTVKQVLAKGVVIVAAAGNSNGGAVGEPANCPGVIAVGGLRHAGSKVGYSDLGAEIGISAPAGNCINTAAGTPCLYPIVAATNSGATVPGSSAWTDSYDFSVGTSFASPLVAAVAGLMFSQQPALTPAQLLAALQATARPFPTTGADNGPNDSTPVPSCYQVSQAGPSGQCYCPNDGKLCGAGMLDAGAAVAAAATTPLARITVTTAAPTAGAVVDFSGASSQAASGNTITAYSWSVAASGGIATNFSSATNASTAALTPSAAGQFTVQLTVTDSVGASASATQAVTVAAAPVTPVTPAAPAAAANSGGGGAASLAWVLGVLLATLVLKAAPRRR